MNSKTIYSGDPNKFIVVVGYPKSGNTWLSRLLADVLDSPVGGLGNAKPLAEEGHERPGDYYVAQLHARPIHVKDHPEDAVGAWHINIPKLRGEKIVHIVRDPRDVAVSAYYYWGLDSIEHALYAMEHGTFPLVAVRDWPSFVSSWLDRGQYRLLWHVYYEQLVYRPAEVIADLLNDMPGVEWDKSRLENAIERQSFDNKKKFIEEFGDNYNYGKDTQLKLLRGGRIGDWHDLFSKDDIRRAALFFGVAAEDYGYDLNGG